MSEVDRFLDQRQASPLPSFAAARIAAVSQASWRITSRVSTTASWKAWLDSRISRCCNMVGGSYEVLSSVAAGPVPSTTSPLMSCSVFN